MEAIGLALCRHGDYGKDYLFRMPRYADLKAGERVIVETKKGEQEATVVSATTVFKGEPEYDMIRIAAGAKEPLKRVLKKVVYRDLFYEGEDFLEEERTDE